MVGHGPDGQPGARKRARAEDKGGRAHKGRISAQVPRPPAPSRTITVGSLCTGMGTAHRACRVLEQHNPDLQFVHKFGCEVSKSCRALLQADFPDLRIWPDLLAEPPLCPVDLLVAGFPCQPFSSANRKRRGLEDARCAVLPLILDYVERAQPRVVIMENVLGLLSFAPDVFQFIAKTLQAAGYQVSCQKLRSDTHGGTPQNRVRLYIVAIRDPVAPLTWPRAKPAPLLSSVLDMDAQPEGSLPSAPKAQAKIHKAEHTLAPLGLTFAERNEIVVNCHSLVGAFFVGRAPCLTSARAAQGGFWLLAQRRMMTTAELLRLQGTPPDMTALGTVAAVSTRAAGLMLGNAFTLSVVTRVLTHALRAIGWESCQDPFE